MNRHALSTCLVPAALMIGTHPAFAQEAGDDIVVTARPLNEVNEVNVGAFGAKNPIDIPIAIQSYDAASIAQGAQRTLLDVLKTDPSVQPASVGGGYDNLRLRGFAVDFTNTLRRDGLSLAPYQDVPLENIERIDVLKGPSGFLYGFNSPGGSVNYLLKRPTKEPFLALTGELTSLKGRYLALDGSTAFAGDAIGLRVNAAWERDGDFDHARDLTRVFLGAAADFRLSDTLLLQVNGDYQRKSATADPLLRADQSGRADPLDPSSYVLPPRIDRRDLLAPAWYRYRSEAWNFDARLEWTFADGWFAFLQASRSQNHRDGAFTDYFDIRPNGTIGFADLFFAPDEEFRVTSVQGYVSGKFETAGIGHELFFGAGHKGFRNPQPVNGYVDTTTVPASAISVVDILDPRQGATYDFGLTGALNKTTRIRESSIFASDLVTLAEPLQLLLGGRYIWYRGTDVSPAGVASIQQDESAFVPTIGVIVKPRRGVMVYASYAKGLEQGEFAPFFANNAFTQSAPIRSTQYELGAKVDLGRGGSLSIAAFQAEKQAGFVNLANDFVIDGTFRHRGIELVASGPVTPRLRVNASLAFLDTELRGVLDPTVLGKRTEGVPKWQGALAADWRVAGIEGLSINGAVNFVTNRSIDSQNSGFIGGYALVDAGARFDTSLSGTPVTFRLTAKNLFDRYYYASAFFLGGLEVGRPREVIASATVRF
jgi:iron complex outermembrane receptor protein